MAEPVLIGPSGFPDRTLAEQVAIWCFRWLRQPDGPDAGRPWEFTDEQFRYLAWWYAIDARDRWLFRRGTLRLMKGAGKDPIAAVIAAVEFAGPCRPVDGKAVEHPAPWVQIAAVSREQTKTTMRLFPGLLSAELIEAQSIEVNKGVIYGRGDRAVIEGVTSAPDSLEGPRTTLTIRNEIQNWNGSNSGHDMAEVIDGNLAKSRDGSARALSLCNAHVPGEDSVGEREWDAWQAMDQGRTRARDVLYIAREAPPDTDMADEASLRAGLEAAAGDAEWLDIDRLIGDVWDPRTPPSEARRKYLNQIVAAEDAWLAPHEWDVLADADRLVADADEVVLGFDGSKSDDHTALIGCRIEDGHLFALGVWDPERHGGEAPRTEIDGTVRQAFEKFDVVGFYSDLHPWESYVDVWAEDLGKGLCIKAADRHPIAWDMRTRTKDFTTQGAERFHDAVVEGSISHDGDSRLREHVHNARRRPNSWGVSLGKEHRESSRKVDAAVAAVLALMARRDYMALPDKKKRRKKTGRAAFA